MPTCRREPPARFRTCAVAAHAREITIPRTAAAEIEDAPGAHTPDELRECTVDCSRVGLFAREARGLVKQLFIKHKIRTFHTQCGKPALAVQSLQRDDREIGSKTPNVVGIAGGDGMTRATRAHGHMRVRDPRSRTQRSTSIFLAYDG
jgi:hypothetical protein